MEYDLRVDLVLVLKFLVVCLNPYSNGRYPMRDARSGKLLAIDCRS